MYYNYCNFVRNVKNKKKMKSILNKVKWGIIGPGKIAHRFADGLKETSSGELIAIASKNEDRRKSFGDDYNINSLLRFGTYEEIIQCSKVDAVYISTPHTLHAEWTIKAANKNKHVLCEKPGAINYAEMKKVIEAVKSAGIFYMEGLMYRCHPQTVKLLKTIKENNIGKIISIDSSFGFDIGKIDSNSRLFNINLAGGSILDVGLYPISFSRLIAGYVSGKKFLNPYKIEGTATIGETGVDEIAYATLYFENKIIANVSTAIRKNMKNSAIIKGTKGSITITNPWVYDKESEFYESLIIVDTEKKKKIIDVKRPEHIFSFEIELANRTIIEKRNEVFPPAMTWDDTLGNIEVLDRWRKSIGYKLPQETI